MKDTDESDNNNDIEVAGEFKKVPIEHSIEIINIINNINKITRDKFKKKFFKISLIAVVIIAFLIITKKMIYDGIIKVLIYDKDELNNNINYVGPWDNKSYDDDNIYNRENIFYIFQNETKIDYNNFASPQLRNPKNIKLIPKLKIILGIEYQKFVHLKIKDIDNKRWEVPEEDIINKEYLQNKNDYEVLLSINSNKLDSEFFYIEYFKRNFSEIKENDNNVEDDNVDYNFDDTYYEEFSFRLMSKENEEFYYFNTSENFLFSDTYINFQSKLTSDNIYGFGERTHDFKLEKGIYTIWPFDCSGTKYDDRQGGMNQYSHQPIGLHKTKYKNLWVGFVFLNTNAQDVVINYNNENKEETFLTHKTIGGIIDYYIIVGDSPEDVVMNIQLLLGIPPLPPYWSFGNHQSRYGIKSFDEFKNIYKNYKKYEIPIDVMWLDIDGMDNYEIFTLNKNFSKIKSFIKNTIHEDGGKFVPIIDIGVSYENNNSTYVKLGNNLDIFIKSNYTKENLIAKVWPGKTVFPDFFNPNVDNFWKKGLDDYYKLVEFDGIWLDMNEPANFVKKSKCLGEIVEDNECTKDKNKYYNEDLPYLPGYRQDFKGLSYWSISENALIYGNNTIYDTKPLLSFYENKITYNYLEEDLQVRPFILSRSTTLGTGKYSFHWLGDNYSTYENLKNSISGLFNFNIFGIPFSGADICGFIRNATKEICLRWYNLGIFYPFMRNHNTRRAKDQYPWSFNDTNKTKYDTISIIRSNINKRYSLIRYMYSQFFLISLNEKGGFFKPLMFEFPEEKISYEDIESRIMFGEAFLICSFYDDNENEKVFELPNSHFNTYPEGKNVLNYEDKNKTIKLSGELNKVHIFVRGGFIIPFQDTFNKYILNTMKLREEKLNVIININNLKESKGVIFFDNDDIDTINRKEYIRVDLVYSDKKLTFDTQINNLGQYEFYDHILGKIEIWRIDEIFKINKEKEKNLKFKINIIYRNKLNKKEIRNGIYDKNNNKVIFEISKDDENVSIFDIDEILFK